MTGIKVEQMVTIKSEYIVMVDVDDTLVMHEEAQKILVPYNASNDSEMTLAFDWSGDNIKIPSSLQFVDVQDPIEDRKITLRINKPMVRLVREEAARGAYVIVWSRGGYQWAKNVVEALGLSSEVKLIMSKPLAYFDDKEVSDWLKYRVYLGPDTIYKK